MSNISRAVFCGADAEARPCGRTDGGYGADAGRVCGRLYSACDRRVCHASVRHGEAPKHSHSPTHSHHDTTASSKLQVKFNV